MTDAQIVEYIKNNDEGLWEYIYNRVKPGFVTTLLNFFKDDRARISNRLDDIFQEASIVLMQNIKQDKFKAGANPSFFAYFVEIGKRIAYSYIKKERKNIDIESGGKGKIIVLPPSEPTILTTEQKQKEQDDFLGRALSTLPPTCKTIFYLVYWAHKSMKEVAEYLRQKNADTAKATKSRCLNKFRGITEKLIDDGEFDKDSLRNAAEFAIQCAVERLTLIELFQDAKNREEQGLAKAAYGYDIYDKDAPYEWDNITLE